MSIDALSLFVADDVAIISVPTHNLVLHSNDDIIYRQHIIIVGTIYYIHDNTNVVDNTNVCDTLNIVE